MATSHKYHLPHTAHSSLWEGWWVGGYVIGAVAAHWCTDRKKHDNCVMFLPPTNPYHICLCLTDFRTKVVPLFRHETATIRKNCRMKQVTVNLAYFCSKIPKQHNLFQKFTLSTNNPFTRFHPKIS